MTAYTVHHRHLRDLLDQCYDPHELTGLVEALTPEQVKDMTARLEDAGIRPRAARDGNRRPVETFRPGQVIWLDRHHTFGRVARVDTPKTAPITCVRMTVEVPARDATDVERMAGEDYAFTDTVTVEFPLGSTAVRGNRRGNWWDLVPGP